MSHLAAIFFLPMMFVAAWLAAAAAQTSTGPSHTFINYARADVDSVRFDGVGGLSGGGATSTFLFAYEPSARDEILDWMFKPDFAGSLDILKVPRCYALTRPHAITPIHGNKSMSLNQNNRWRLGRTTKLLMVVKAVICVPQPN